MNQASKSETHRSLDIIVVVYVELFWSPGVTKEKKGRCGFSGALETRFQVRLYPTPIAGGIGEPVHKVTIESDSRENETTQKTHIGGNTRMLKLTLAPAVELVAASSMRWTWPRKYVRCQVQRWSVVLP